MKIGDIYIWETDRAKGHNLRRKFHLYIGEAGWRDDGHAFLFISSNDYGGDFQIFQTDYNFLTKENSYISCNGIVVYPVSELERVAPIKVGTLRTADAANLHAAIAGSETMEQWQIRLCCDAVAHLIR
jgi:hypothetical protein